MTMPPQDYNAGFHQNTINEANAASNAAYQSGMLEFQNQQLAFQKAQQAWKETMDKAGLTGMYENQWTLPAQMGFATTFGTWGAPQQGQQTLAGQQQQWQQAFNTAGQYGQYYGPGQGPAAGTKTQQQLEQEYTQGLRTQQEARAAQAQAQSQAQSYLSLLASLRGPADWQRYQQVLASSPGGMRDVVGAAMGQYVPGGGATTGYAPQAASLQSMMGDVTGQPYYGQGGGQLGTPSVYQYNPAVYGQQPTGAQQTAQMLQGQTNPQAYAQQAMQQPQQQNNQAQNAMGNGTNTMGGPQNQMNLPAPNQIAPQSWQALPPSSREMLLGSYESSGWHRPDVEALFNQSLPKYGANAPTAGTFKLR